MVPSQIIKRVFRIALGDECGTMFSLDVDGRQYLITAKHLVSAASGKFVIDVFHNGQWVNIPVELVGHSPTADVSVLAPSQLFTLPDLAVAASSASMIYGQDAYFLGFPYNLHGDIPHILNGFPLPFVKKGIVSMMDTKTTPTIYLDGINNEGFSGGPMAFQIGGTQNWSIAGVVGGYISASEPVELNDEDIGLRYAANTGLIDVAPITRALELIESNPIGFKLP